MAHDGVAGVRRHIALYLVHSKKGTRRLLRELVAFGAFGPEDGEGMGAMDGPAVSRAAQRAGRARAVWAAREEQRQQKFERRMMQTEDWQQQRARQGVR